MFRHAMFSIDYEAETNMSKKSPNVTEKLNNDFEAIGNCGKYEKKIENRKCYVIESPR